MRITEHKNIIAVASLAALVLLGAGYLVGYWAVYGESWLASLTIKRMISMPWQMVAGFAFIAIAYGAIVGRLIGFGKGRSLNRSGLVLASLGLLAAMYLATYDQLTLIDAYPFAALFVLLLLIFRFERRVVAAVVVGVILLSFYILGAKELGERDAERSLLAMHQYQILIIG